MSKHINPKIRADVVAVASKKAASRIRGMAMFGAPTNSVQATAQIEADRIADQKVRQKNQAFWASKSKAERAAHVAELRGSGAERDARRAQAWINEYGEP